MNDLVEKTPGADASVQTPAETAPQTSVVKTTDLAGIAATLPPGDHAETGKAVAPDASKPPKFREGRPCKLGNCGKCKNCVRKGSFGAPVTVPAKQPAPAVTQGDSRPEDLSGEDDAQGNPEDYLHYGRAGGALVQGIVETKIANVRDIAVDKLGEEAVERLFSRVRFDPSHLADLELFYQHLAMALKAPKGGGILAHGLTLHFNLIRGLSRDLRSIRRELEKLPSAQSDTP